MIYPVPRTFLGSIVGIGLIPEGSMPIIKREDDGRDPVYAAR